MLTKRAFRVASIVVLAGLALIVGVESHHAPGQVQADDTTWLVQQGDGGNGGGSQIQSLDTTW
ncbi:hypothetical protein [Streptomyces spiralis]|uniref:hypothetical protein n=1 Tax=Streptomyces spiralis TaxID=66376 RepID=UPI00340E7FF2